MTAPPGDDALPINERLSIPRHELSARASRAGGAGGQHVNTSSTRIDGEGVIRVVASDRRSQRQNRESAEERLAELVRKALVIPKKRRATKPSRASKERRITEKKRRGETKAARRKDRFD